MTTLELRQMSRSDFDPEGLIRVAEAAHAEVNEVLFPNATRETRIEWWWWYLRRTVREPQSKLMVMWEVVQNAGNQVAREDVVAWSIFRRPTLDVDEMATPPPVPGPPQYVQALLSESAVIEMNRVETEYLGGRGHLDYWGEHHKLPTLHDAGSI